ncbi:hypothetical protein CBR_g20364 [Chara braunii]|uniref:rRNA methyltransferase 1, mitochondrial n=1 Tax=Chara braunii TaxID=69332 RepID=A0A388JU39_CHABU|nr:hypothetical protein CBR_g20364 [Chara braunii]|eukprot:GBG61329.1 hypothetical protein CBR_g20364 [Chara braunii]
MEAAGVATRSLWNQSGSQSVLKRLAELRRVGGAAGGEGGGGGGGVFGGGRLSGPQTFPKGNNLCKPATWQSLKNCNNSLLLSSSEWGTLDTCLLDPRGNRWRTAESVGTVVATASHLFKRWMASGKGKSICERCFWRSRRWRRRENESHGHNSIVTLGGGGSIRQAAAARRQETKGQGTREIGEVGGDTLHGTVHVCVCAPQQQLVRGLDNTRSFGGRVLPSLRAAKTGREGRRREGIGIVPMVYSRWVRSVAGQVRLDEDNCHVSNQEEKGQDRLQTHSSMKGSAKFQRAFRRGGWTDGDYADQRKEEEEEEEEEEGKEVVMTRARRGQWNPRKDHHNKDGNGHYNYDGSRNSRANKWWEEGEEGEEEEGDRGGWDTGLQSSPSPPSRQGAWNRTARGGEGRGYGRGYGDDMKDRSFRGKRGGDGDWERTGVDWDENRPVRSMRGVSRGGGGSEREQARWREREEEEEEEEEEQREPGEGTWDHGREQRGSGRERGFSGRRAGSTDRARSGGSAHWQEGRTGGRFGANSRTEGYGREESEEGEGRERLTTIKRRILGEIIYGVSPVVAALGALRREIYGLYVQEGLESKRKKDRRGVDMVMKKADELRLTAETVSKHELNLLCDNRPHQGLVLDASPLQFVDVKEIPPPEEDKDWQHLPDGRVVAPCWVALDEVMDPQNFGAVLRSAYFLGATGVVTCARNSAPLSAVVSKASSGAMEAMQVYSCKNMFKFLSQCRANGWRVLGASSSPTAVACRDLARGVPTIFVVGNEGVGLRENVQRECTEMVRIPGSARTDLGGRPFVIDSLNVSVAAGILLHELLMPCQRVVGTGYGGEQHPGGLSALDWSDSSTSQEHQPEQHEDGRQATLAAWEETQSRRME